MAEFMTVMREYGRMCDESVRCGSCPIASNNSGRGIACHLFVRKFPKEAERIIMQWASEHPIMTNRRKFEEVFGFTPATMFEINWGNAEWLDEEYKGGDSNDS